MLFTMDLSMIEKKLKSLDKAKIILLAIIFLTIALPISTILVASRTLVLPEIFVVYPNPSSSVSPSASPSTIITAIVCWDAKDGTITEPFKADSDGHVSQTVKTNDDPAKGGKAAYIFDLAQAGDYIATASAHAPDSGNNSFFANIDSEPTTGNVWALKPNGSKFTNQTVSWGNDYNKPRKVFSLTSGSHTLIIRGREDKTELARVCINSLISVSPSPSPSVSASPSPSGTASGFSFKVFFEGLAADGQDLSVTIKAVDTDWQKTVLVNTDGSFQNLDLTGLDTSKTYDFILYAHPYLTIKRNVNLTSLPTTVDFGTAKIGDLNADNQINSLDWSWMRNNFGLNGDE